MATGPLPEPLEAAGEALALRSIRDALLPEEVGDFDREFRQVMSEATESLDLTGVLAFARRWRRVAQSSLDPQTHRRMLAQAEALNAGATIPTEPWSATKARLGLQVYSVEISDEAQDQIAALPAAALLLFAELMGLIEIAP